MTLSRRFKSPERAANSIPRLTQPALMPHHSSENYDLEALEPAEIPRLQMVQAAIPFDLFEASHDALLREPTCKH
jgi:hypothetical protein